MPRYNEEGMIEKPEKMSERWFRHMYSNDYYETEVNGLKVTFQRVSPRWYYNTNDQCGMTGDKKDTARYMDLLFKNVVVEPAALRNRGMTFFDELEDVETPEKLLREIELYLRPGKRYDNGATPSKSE